MVRWAVEDGKLEMGRFRIRQREPRDLGWVALARAGPAADRIGLSQVADPGFHRSWEAHPKPPRRFKKNINGENNTRTDLLNQVLARTTRAELLP